MTYKDLDEETSAQIICVVDEGALVNIANSSD